MKDKLTELQITLKNFWNAYKTKKRFWITIVIVIIITVLIIYNKGGNSVEGTVTAEITNVVDSVMLSGRTESASAVKLGFADQGRIARVSVKEGDAVREGAILAELDTADLRASLENAQATLTIAKAGLVSDTTNLENVIREQDILVANAYRTLLSSGLEAVPDNTDLAVNPPVITGTYTGQEGVYNIRVYQSGTASGESFAVTGLESGDLVQPVTDSAPVPLGTRGLHIQFGSESYFGTNLHVSIPNKQSAVYGTNYNAYQAALAARDRAITNARSSIGGNALETSVAQAKVTQARASVAGIVAQIEKRIIRAPFDGVVASSSIKPGQSTTSASVGSSETGATITLISENDYQVTLKAPEISVAKLIVGQPVSIILDAYGKDTVFPGKIVSINPAETITDGVPIYETKVLFTETDPRIRSGMTATARIIANQHDNVVAVPASFIHSDESGSFVYVITSDHKTEKRSVTVGLRGSDSKVEITQGIAAGEQVSAESLK